MQKPNCVTSKISSIGMLVTTSAIYNGNLFSSIPGFPPRSFAYLQAATQLQKKHHNRMGSKYAKNLGIEYKNFGGNQNLFDLSIIMCFKVSSF